MKAPHGLIAKERFFYTRGPETGVALDGPAVPVSVRSWKVAGTSHEKEALADGACAEPWFENPVALSRYGTAATPTWSFELSEERHQAAAFCA
jgi:hypothetical protein